MRIIHLSDIHIWRYVYNPFHLVSKRAVGIASLLAGRARKFRLERIEGVVERVLELDYDHVLITGDLTTTALTAEFDEARRALDGLLTDPERATVLPGNHDRYTARSVRTRAFERVFGEFAPSVDYPWLRRLDPETAILGLDATRSHLSARGRLPADQFERARALLANPADRPRRLIVGCHYPVAAPLAYASELNQKRMVNAEAVRQWLAGLGPHLYCSGHVHAAWVFTPEDVPEQLGLNAGAPLLRDPTGRRPPGFLEIDLTDQTVSVVHHAWTGHEWSIFPLVQAHRLFARPSSTPAERTVT
ncbi:metallophosphoesterase [soil metagenome]